MDIFSIDLHNVQVQWHAAIGRAIPALLQRRVSAGLGHSLDDHTMFVVSEVLVYVAAGMFLLLVGFGPNIEVTQQRPLCGDKSEASFDALL